MAQHQEIDRVEQDLRIERDPRIAVRHHFEQLVEQQVDIDVDIHLLLDQLLKVMSNSNSRIPFNAQILLNTINFLVLRHPTTTPSTQVMHSLKNWHQKRDKYKNGEQALPAAKDVL